MRFMYKNKMGQNQRQGTAFNKSNLQKSRNMSSTAGFNNFTSRFTYGDKIQSKTKIKTKNQLQIQTIIPNINHHVLNRRYKH